MARPSSVSLPSTGQLTCGLATPGLVVVGGARADRSRGFFSQGRLPGFEHSLRIGAPLDVQDNAVHVDFQDGRIRVARSHDLAGQVTNVLDGLKPVGPPAGEDPEVVRSHVAEVGHDAGTGLLGVDEVPGDPFGARQPQCIHGARSVLVG